jgi:hypothetical protein
MAQYSLNTSMIQRSAGSSAVAHVAYITAAKIVDLRTGQEADYTRRDGVLCLAPEIVLPAGERETQSAKIERGQLWNMAEAAEKRKDGNPARKVLVALPHELGPEQRLTMTQQYAQWMADRYGVAVDFAIHKPDREGDQRNYHAHMVLTTRQIRDGQLAEKSQLEWKGARLKEAGLPSGIAMVYELRESWETIQNEHLSRYAPEVEPVSCQRLKMQCEAQLQKADRLQQEGREAEAREAQLKAIELDRTPQQHVGWAATAMERRREPVPTERGEQRRQAQREHQELRSLVAEIRKRIARALAWVEHFTQKPKKMKPPEQGELLELVELATVEPVATVLKPDLVQEAQKTPMPVVETPAPVQAASAEPPTTAIDQADQVRQEAQAAAAKAKEDQLQAAITWLREHHSEAVLLYPPNGAHHFFKVSIEMCQNDAEKAGLERTRDVIVPHLLANKPRARRRSKKTASYTRRSIPNREGKGDQSGRV